MARRWWAGAVAGIVILASLVSCETGGEDPGPGAPEDGAPGAPVGTDPGDGGAQGAPVTIPPFTNLSGDTLDKTKEAVNARVAEHCEDGTVCLDVQFVEESTGTERCEIGDSDPPEGTEVYEGDVITVPITCQESEEEPNPEDTPPDDESTDGS